jgi:hypothetical protein
MWIKIVDTHFLFLEGVIHPGNLRKKVEKVGVHNIPQIPQISLKWVSMIFSGIVTWGLRLIREARRAVLASGSLCFEHPGAEAGRKGLRPAA